MFYVDTDQSILYPAFFVLFNKVNLLFCNNNNNDDNEFLIIK